LATGRSFRFTFDKAGTYTYFCHIHPATMRGEVDVS
jgi:plastocyanin